mmetsp:Transcript_28365/g.69091  ORF Transcript_28365/g.69091 Transcript_28365/m.69091 type:complete len:397 (-) Transcript_28365:722-1912(-)
MLILFFYTGKYELGMFWSGQFHFPAQPNGGEHKTRAQLRIRERLRYVLHIRKADLSPVTQQYPLPQGVCQLLSENVLGTQERLSHHAVDQVVSSRRWGVVVDIWRPVRDLGEPVHHTEGLLILPGPAQRNDRPDRHDPVELTAGEAELERLRGIVLVQESAHDLIGHGGLFPHLLGYAIQQVEGVFRSVNADVCPHRQRKRVGVRSASERRHHLHNLQRRVEGEEPIAPLHDPVDHLCARLGIDKDLEAQLQPSGLYSGPHKIHDRTRGAGEEPLLRRAVLRQRLEGLQQHLVVFDAGEVRGRREGGVGHRGDGECRQPLDAVSREARPAADTLPQLEDPVGVAARCKGLRDRQDGGLGVHRALALFPAAPAPHTRKPLGRLALSQPSLLRIRIRL